MMMASTLVDLAEFSRLEGYPSGSPCHHIAHTVVATFFLFFSGTVERAPARPYYDKTQRMPHAQPDRDVSYLAKLTAMVVGGYCTPGVGFSPTESSTKHKGDRSGPAWENGAHVGTGV